MKSKIFFNCFLGLAGLLTGSFNYCFAQNDSALNTNPYYFLRQTQLLDSRPGKMGMAMWIPWQFWNFAAVYSGTTNDPDVQKVISSLESSIVFAVADGQIVQNGKLPFYKTEQAIRDSITLVVNDSVVLKPLRTEELDDLTAFMLYKLESSSFSTLMTKAGYQMYFFVFPNKDKKGNALVNGAKKGKMELRWEKDYSYQWMLPLDVLAQPKFCPVDGQSFGGSFEFCPYHGNKLSTSTK